MLCDENDELQFIILCLYETALLFIYSCWEKEGMRIGVVVWMDRKDAFCRYVRLFVCGGIHVL